MTRHLHRPVHPHPSAVVVLLAILSGCVDRHADRPPDSAAAPPTPSATESVAPVMPAGRAVPAGDSEMIERAREHLESPIHDARCGPYGVVTDLSTDALDTLCGAPVWNLDKVYARRLGVEIAYSPRGTVVLFARRSGYRAYVAAGGRLPHGYAGFTLAGRGMVVLPVDRLTTEEVVPTLAHELAHLAHRRTFGPELAPWLAEGLADAVGDTATVDEFAPLHDFAGVQAMRDRLLAAYQRGDAGSLDRLVALSRAEFDRGTPAYDYAQAALLVRFLLQDSHLAPRFRGYLQGLTLHRHSPSPTLDQALESPWPDLEAALRAWLQDPDGLPRTSRAEHGFARTRCRLPATCRRVPWKAVT